LCKSQFIEESIPAEHYKNRYQKVNFNCTGYLQKYHRATIGGFFQG